MRTKEESRFIQIVCFFLCTLRLWLEAPLTSPHPQENQESEPQSANLIDFVAQLHNFHWFH